MTTSDYDADTQTGNWYSPTTGEKVLHLVGIDFEMAHEISAAISLTDKIARVNAKLQMHIEVERFMDTLTRVGVT